MSRSRHGRSKRSKRVMQKDSELPRAFCAPPLRGPESYRSSIVLTNLLPGGSTSRRPCMMKQILLRVTAMFAEIFLHKLTQLQRCWFPFSRKILFPQHSLDPDIDRER